jgi:hypothetical protein
MPYFCARLLVVVIVDTAKPRKRNTCDYPFFLIKAKDHMDAFKRALELGHQSETTYLNSRKKKVRWAFVRVEAIRRLPRTLDSAEVGSLLDVLITDEPLSVKKRFSPEKHMPLFD